MSKRKPLIGRKESIRYPGLFVKKYSKKVFWDNMWNSVPESFESRGHVETADGTLVIAPFTKIFNFMENGTKIDRDELVIMVEKINGFMAAATFVPEVDDVVISTTGSLDSDFVDLAKKYIPIRVIEYIRDLYKQNKTRTTFLFEITAHEDPHVIPECHGAFLIGVRDVKDTGSYKSDEKKERYLDNLALELQLNRPNWMIIRFGSVVQMAKTSKIEGYVVYSPNTVLKIKTKYYLVTKFLGRLGKEKVKRMATNPTSFRKEIDEEFYPVLDMINHHKDEFMAMGEQERMQFIRDAIDQIY